GDGLRISVGSDAEIDWLLEELAKVVWYPASPTISAAFGGGSCWDDPHQTLRLWWGLAPTPMTARTAQIRRETGETKITLGLNLDGVGKAQLATGVGFFDHLLNLLARHSLIDLDVEAQGDLHVDAHHTVE